MINEINYVLRSVVNEEELNEDAANTSSRILIAKRVPLFFLV